MHHVVPLEMGGMELENVDQGINSSAPNKLLNLKKGKCLKCAAVLGPEICCLLFFPFFFQIKCLQYFGSEIILMHLLLWASPELYQSAPSTKWPRYSM